MGPRHSPGQSHPESRTMPKSPLPTRASARGGAACLPFTSSGSWPVSCHPSERRGEQMRSWSFCLGCCASRSPWGWQDAATRRRMPRPHCGAAAPALTTPAPAAAPALTNTRGAGCRARTDEHTGADCRARTDEHTGADCRAHTGRVWSMAEVQREILAHR